MKIIPITSTNIDWKPFLLITQSLLGRSVTKVLDSKNIPSQTLPGFVNCLGEFLSEDTDPISLLREPGALLGFIYQGFVVISDQESIYDINCESDLKIITIESYNSKVVISIVNGTFLQWREGIINSCSPITSYAVREFYSQVLEYLDKIGFAKTFEHYSRKKNDDGTYFLQLK